MQEHMKTKTYLKIIFKRNPKKQKKCIGLQSVVVYNIEQAQTKV
jgi:hypothetical protein